MPAFNAELTLEKTFRGIPAGSVDEVILTDDFSSDRTCYDVALNKGADIVVMIHPDYQYDSRLIPYALGFLKNNICDIIMGSRIRSRREALEGGMPRYKYISNRILTTVENMVLGQNLGDFHSGFRVYKRRVLETIPYKKNSDDFVFDTEFLTQAIFWGFKIGDVPIPCRYFKEASSINFVRSLKYGFQTLLVMGIVAKVTSGQVQDFL